MPVKGWPINYYASSHWAPGAADREVCGGFLPSDQTTLEALQARGSMGAFDKEWREEAMARGLGRTTYYRSRGTLLELGYVEQVMNKYFVKSSCKNEVP